MKKLTKILALVLALCMMISIGAFASAEPSGDKASGVPSGDKASGVPSGDKASGAPSGDKQDAGVPAADVPAELTTWIDVSGKEVAEGTAGATAVVTPNFGKFGYFGGGGDGDYNFRTALYYGVDGLDEEKSVTGAVVGGSYDDQSVKGVTIDSTTSDFNSIIVVGDGTANSAKLAISDSKISAITDSDGSAVSDFTGLGAAVYASEGATVTIDNSTIETTGVAKVGLMVDDYAAILATNTYVHTQGGKLYDSYLSTANQAVMVAPPWVLGIQGNCRSANVEGQSAVLAVYNSEIVSGSWGILSVDAGSNMTVFSLDSVLTLDNSNEVYADDPFVTDEPKNGMTENYGTGYCSYGIGSPREWFLGSTINVGTYAVCITGGYATYGASNGTFDVYATDKNAEKVDFIGCQVVGLAAQPTFTGLVGAGNITTVNSDGFGFMFHGAGGVLVTEGTVVNTDEATFLIKTSGTTAVVDDGSQLNTANGILYQMMDNDDSAVGMDSSLGAQVFRTSYSEAAGWPSAIGGVKGAGGTKYNNFTLEGTEATGNIYNGTGYYGNANALAVTLGAGATLNGAIAATEIIHADENYSTAMTAEQALACQKTDFPAEQYYYINRVANRIFYNGFNVIDVVLTDDAVWNVTGVSVVTTLTAAPTASVNGTVYQHDGFIVVTPVGEADPYAGMTATPAYAAGESAAFSAIGAVAAAAPAAVASASGDGFDVTINLNGEEFTTVHIGVAVNGDSYTFDVSDVLAKLGVSLSYDEATGIATVTAADAGMLAALLGIAPAAEPVAEPAADKAAGVPSAEPSAEAPADDGMAGQTNVLAGTAQPATQAEFDGYVAYVKDYMTNYAGVGDGTFDDSARDMAIGELAAVSFGDDVNAFPFEMYVSVFGAQDFASWNGASAAPAADKAAGLPAADKSAGAPAGGDTSDAAYQEYLCAFVASCEDILASGAQQEFYDTIHAGDYVSFPVEMLFDATWFGEAAMSYDEFVAAGGVYAIGDHLSNGSMMDGTGEG